MVRKLADVHTVLGHAGSAIEQWSTASVHQKESLKVFFLVLQVCHYLMCGQVESGSLTLTDNKQLIVIIIIIMWLVKWKRATSMSVDSVLNDRQLSDQC